jgi:hypothetical protein
MDSGASISVTPYETDLHHYTKLTKSRYAQTANGENVPIKGIGELRINTGRSQVRLRCVNHSSDLTTPLISVSHFIGDTDDMIIFTKSGFHWFNSNTNNVEPMGYKKNRLYYFYPPKVDDNSYNHINNSIDSQHKHTSLYATQPSSSNTSFFPFPILGLNAVRDKEKVGSGVAHQSSQAPMPSGCNEILKIDFIIIANVC